VRYNIFSIIILAGVSFVSCRKKDDPAPPGSPKLNINFKNVAGDKSLSLDGSWYITDAGDSLKVTELKYYITNIILYTDSGQFVQPESYYLVDESDDVSKSWVIEGIPASTYKKISFMIGVDARRNTDGARTGALDPAHGMFWDWNSGYIMAKLEGVSPSIASAGHKLSYHIAGFKGFQSAVRSVTLIFPSPIEINPSATKTVHINGDILEWFKTPEVIKLGNLPSVSGVGADAVKVADNYADMFKIDSVE